jgi:hypothetical protein
MLICLLLTIFVSLLHLHLMHCTISLLAHVYSYTLDRMETELEEPMEQAQVEEFTNLALDQGKPWCI